MYRPACCKSPCMLQTMVCNYAEEADLKGFQWMSFIRNLSNRIREEKSLQVAEQPLILSGARCNLRGIQRFWNCSVSLVFTLMNLRQKGPHLAIPFIIYQLCSPSTHAGFQNITAARKTTGSLAGKSTGYLRCGIKRIISQAFECGKVK